MMIGRRSLIRGMAAFLAAPAIVRAASLMPIRAVQERFISLDQTGHCIDFMIFSSVLSDTERAEIRANIAHYRGFGIEAEGTERARSAA